jgi:hypothetical protein
MPLSRPGQKQHHSSKTSTRIVQQNFIEDFSMLKVLAFYSHIHAHLMEFDIAPLIMAQLLAETCRGEDEQKHK